MFFHFSLPWGHRDSAAPLLSLKHCFFPNKILIFKTRYYLIHSGTSACEESVKSSLKCSCTISVRPFRCSTFSVLSVSSTLSKTEVMMCGGGPFKRDDAPNCVASLHRRVACVRLIFCRALCNAMERVFRFTEFSSRLRSRHSPRISIFVSSCGSRYFFFNTLPFHNRVCNCIGNCSKKWNVLLRVGSILGKFTAPVHRVRRACSHGAVSLRKLIIFALKNVFLPIVHRLNSLPPSMLCFQKCSQVCELIRSRISHVTCVSPYPAHVLLQVSLRHFPHVTEQDCQRSVLPRHELLTDESRDE